MTVAALLVARKDDDRTALRTAEDERTWSWREVVEESAVRASALTALSHTRPLHIGVLLENVPEYVFVLGGAALAGHVVVGINPTRRGEELARDVRTTDCAVVLTDRTQASLLDGLDLGASCPVLDVDGTEWQQLLDDARDTRLAATPPASESLYLLLFTSGSTGAPKAVRVSQGRAARTATRFRAPKVLREIPAMCVTTAGRATFQPAHASRRA